MHADKLQKPKTKTKSITKTALKKAAVSKLPAAKKATKSDTKSKAPTKKRSKPDTEDEPSEPEHPSFHDDTLLSNTPPSAKKQKKGPPPKKMSGKPLQPVENEVPSLDGPSDPKTKKGATDQYQKVRWAKSVHVSMLTRSLAHAVGAHHQAAGHVHRVG